MRKNIIFIADTHLLHDLAICPPNLILSKGTDKPREVTLITLQYKIWEHWRYFWDVKVPSWINADDFTCVVCGDLVENYTRRSFSIMTIAPSDVVEAGSLLLSQILDNPKCKNMLLITGTDVHVGIEGDLEKEVHKVLNGAYPDKMLGVYNRKVLKVNNVYIHVAHHIGGSYRPYTQGTPLAVELNIMNDAYARAKMIVPDIIVRAHSHIYRKFELDNQLVITLPAWTAINQYAVNRIPGARTNPIKATIGGVLIQIEDDKWQVQEYIHKIKDDDLVLEL